MSRYGGNIIEFRPSRTPVGKTIDAEFAESLKTVIEGVDTDEKLAEVLNSIKKDYPRSWFSFSYPYIYNSKHQEPLGVPTDQLTTRWQEDVGLSSSNVLS